MNAFRRWAVRIVALAVPVLVAVAVLAVAIANRSAPTRGQVPEARRCLFVIDVPQVALVPRVLGYGDARSADVWRAIAEVDGRAIEVHPHLLAGAFVDPGEVMLRIDPIEYELSIAQIEAQLAQIEADLSKLEAQQQNYTASLAIEESSLKLAQSELARFRQLARTRVTAESEMEQQERTVLAQQQTIQNLRNSLNLLPANRAALEASRNAMNASLKQARIDLDKTVVKAPFRCRIGEVAIEQGQYLSTSEVLFEANGVEVIDVEAQFPIDQLRRMIDPSQRPRGESITMGDVRRILDFDAIVRLRAADLEVSWEGRVDRLREGIDPRTRALRLVIAVDDPFGQAEPGRRPPLTPGMFCEVELRGRPRPDQIVIPRSAMEAGHVYVVDSTSRLRHRPIAVKFVQGGLVCVESGIQPGETLVVADPTPAIEGMLVIPETESAAAQALVDEATGVGRLR